MRRRVLLPAIVLIAFAVGVVGCYVKFPTFGGRIQLEEHYLKKADTKDKILVIPLSGVITSSSSRGTFSSTANMVEELGMQLEKARRDKRIKGVILSINSPGGGATASEIMYHKIMQFKREKDVPVVVLMGDVAASGAYYISMAADRIVAHPSTVTGSIGVISMFLNLEGLMGKVGVEVVTLKTGEMKDVGSFARQMTELEKEYIMSILNDMFNIFVDRVASSRKQLTRDEILELADGRVYTAKQALEAKLIDEIGYFEDAASATKKKAGITSASLVAYEWDWNHKYDVYSMMSPKGPIDINLLKIDLATLDSLGRPGFYYLWAE